MKYLRHPDGSVWTHTASLASMPGFVAFEADPARIPAAGIPDLVAFLADEKPAPAAEAPPKPAAKRPGRPPKAK